VCHDSTTSTAQNASTLSVKYKVGFITTNFYDEITQPQQIGMLNFFDFVYLTKAGQFKSPISQFANIISDLKVLYT
jgi:type II restriction enzyme